MDVVKDSILAFNGLCLSQSLTKAQHAKQQCNGNPLFSSLLTHSVDLK